MKDQLITKKNGKVKTYIYKSDIAEFLDCGHDEATRIFNLVKDYEIELLQIEMFENRVPQQLFHRYRNLKRKRG